MKVHWIALLIVIGALLFAPAVSAKIIEEKDGYIVSTVNGNPFAQGISPMGLSSITQGKTDVYSTSIPSGKISFSPYLYWGVLSDSLSLTIVAPDSQLGPFYDSSDGLLDGRISLMITKTNGLAPGTWKSYVYGYQVSGSQSYSYSTIVS